MGLNRSGGGPLLGLRGCLGRRRRLWLCRLLRLLCRLLLLLLLPGKLLLSGRSGSVMYTMAKGV